MAVVRNKSGRSHARTDETDAIDVYVGGRVRTLCQMRGMSQAALAARLGLTFQQVQKYQSGMNRISASRLVQISRILNAPVGYFFEGVEQGKALDLPDGTFEMIEAWAVLSPHNRRVMKEAMKALAAPR